MSNIAKAAAGVMLDAIMHQQRLLSANIVNANQSQYRAQSLDFDRVVSQLSGVIEQGQGFARLSEQIAAHDYDRHVESTDAISVEQTVAQISTHVVQYKALLAALSKQGALMRTVVEAQG